MKRLALVGIGNGADGKGCATHRNGAIANTEPCGEPRNSEMLLRITIMRQRAEG